MAAHATGNPDLYVVAVFFSLGVVLMRAVVYMKAGKEAEVMQKGNQARVVVIQNGPFETIPSGSAWYIIGDRIELKAIPVANHAFRVWTSDTKLIEVLNPYSVSTVAVVKGGGTITANFY